MKKSLELAFRLFESQNIPVFIFKPSENNLERFDGTLRKVFFKKENYEMIRNWILENCNKQGNIYLLEDFFRLCILVVPLGKDKACEENFFVAAPFTFENLSKEDVKDILQKLGGKEADVKPLYSFYRNIKTTGLSRERFQSFLCSLFPCILARDDMHFIYHYFAKGESYLYSEKSAKEKDFEQIKEIEKRYMIEDSMLDAVSVGNAQQAIFFYKKLLQTGIKPRTPNAIRNLKNFSIVLNSHLRKIMEKSGVHPFYVDELSREFAISIEQCTSNIQIIDLAVLMIKSYCKQITEHKTAGFSSLIQNCIIYVDFHFTEYISLQTISKKLHVNASYLSAQFAKETGETLSFFINKTRIEHSLPMLNEKARSIESIANDCGFDDMNYFSRVFKKITGCSPSEYRKKHP